MNETLTSAAGSALTGASLFLFLLLVVLAIMWILFPFLMLRALKRLQKEVLELRVDNEQQAELAAEQRRRVVELLEKGQPP